MGAVLGESGGCFEHSSVLLWFSLLFSSSGGVAVVVLRRLRGYPVVPGSLVPVPVLDVSSLSSNSKKDGVCPVGVYLTAPSLVRVPNSGWMCEYTELMPVTRWCGREESRNEESTFESWSAVDKEGLGASATGRRGCVCVVGCLA